MLAARTTLLQRCCSLRMKAAYSAGPEPIDSASSAANRSCTLGSLAAFAASAARRWITALGVRAGAFNPYHCEVSKPGYPCSATVGTSDSVASRFAVPTAPKKGARVVFAARAVGPRARDRRICFAAEARR